jgi:hypothetical protein
MQRSSSKPYVPLIKTIASRLTSLPLHWGGLFAFGRSSGAIRINIRAAGSHPALLESKIMLNSTDNSAIEEVTIPENEIVEEPFVVKMYKAIFSNDSEGKREVVNPDEIAKRMIGYVGSSVEEMITKLETRLQLKADTLAVEIPFIAPLTDPEEATYDYDNLVYGYDSKADYLKSVASQKQFWCVKEAEYIDQDDVMGPDIIKVSFANVSFNKAEDMEGVVFVNKRGKIRHALVRRIGL